MDRMKKILSSPISKRKNGNGPSSPANINPATTPPATPRYFGLLLEDLTRQEGTIVPRLVTKICTFIEKNGIGQEGIFRVNGNSRVVEKLRMSFEQKGDADLDEAGDVMAVAGLLKLFLRELPEGVISERNTAEFVKAQEECVHNKPECLRRLKVLLGKLPMPNYSLLKYLCRFLVLVSLRENTNKMNPMALGIIFGPNLFRCIGGIEGLRQQGVTNQITLHFVTKYDDLFLAEGEISPYNSKFLQVQEAKKSKVPPPRPPPPKVEGTYSPPVPSPRKAKHRERIAEMGIPHDVSEDGGGSGETTPHSSSALTPRFSDDEYLDTYRSSSPFVLDSDRSEAGSGVASPLAVLTQEQDRKPVWVVERTISSTVSQHLFGESGSSEDNLSDIQKENTSPVPAPRKKRRELREQQEMKEISGNENLEKDPNASVKQRIQQFEVDDDDSTESSDASKPLRQRPKSKAFELFENQGIMFTPAPESLAKTLGSMRDDQADLGQDDSDGSPESSPHTRPRPKPRSPKKKPRSPNRTADEDFDSSHTSQDSVHTVPDSDDSGFGSIHRSATTLATFKRAPGPKNRRTPSRKSLRKSLGQDGVEGHLGHIEEYEDENDENIERQPKPRIAFELKVGEEDLNHNATKPSTNFLNFHHNGGLEDRTEQSPDRSPTSCRKPYVPPLDLTILHEHGDGSDPILAEQGPSLALHKSHPFREDDNVMLSPRMSKLKKKPKVTIDEGPLSPSAFRIITYASAHHDTDVPPSPPTEQSLFTKGTNRSDDEHSAQVKQLTKKIQSCKKKIKLFEESYEEEYGYRPSQSDKAARPEMKKNIQELAKARKELRNANLGLSPGYSPLMTSTSSVFTFETEAERWKQGVADWGLGSYGTEWGTSSGYLSSSSLSSCGLKDDVDSSDRVSDLPSHDTPSSGSADRHILVEETPRMEDTLQVLRKRLSEKRRDANRPEDMTIMTRDQVQEEKLAVQKALLQFENLHGRPTSKSEKELMKPLYDRYRTVKRLLSKPLSPHDKLVDLQPVPEDHTMEFPSPSTSTKSSNRVHEPVTVPVADHLDDQEFGTTDFMVTRDLGLLKDTLRPADGNSPVNPDLSPEGPVLSNPKESSLHELSVSQLVEEQRTARLDKKRLRKVLREFEDDFFRQTGRKVQKEDREPMDSEYHEYKQIKARLKLLEALITKHDPTAVM